MFKLKASAPPTGGTNLGVSLSRIRRISHEFARHVQGPHCDSYFAELNSILDELGVPREQQAAPANKTTSIDGNVVLYQLRNGELTLDVASRYQLIAVAIALGCQDTETKAQPVKKLRELVSSRMSVPVQAPSAIKAAPKIGVSAPVIKGTATTLFRLPRRLTP